VRVNPLHTRPQQVIVIAAHCFRHECVAIGFANASLTHGLGDAADDGERVAVFLAIVMPRLTRPNAPEFAAVGARPARTPLSVAS